MKSIIQQRGGVVFPPHTGERIYMREFFRCDGLPDDLRRWQPTIDAMLDGVDADGPIYLMVDQGTVRAGATHRRPGVHIDGFWNPAKYAHGMSRDGHDYFEPAPAPRPGRHSSELPSKGDAPATQPDQMWSPVQREEGLILASDVAGCRGFVGEWGGAPAEGGDCSHVDLSGLTPVMMHPRQAYAGNVGMLHESLPVPFDCLRTVVRLNVPGWAP